MEDRRTEAGTNNSLRNPNVWLTREAKCLGVPKKELLVLSANNDPYNCGTPAHLAAAEWFAGVYGGLVIAGYTFGACTTEPMTPVL